MLDWVKQNAGSTDHLLLAAQWEIVDAFSEMKYNGPFPFAVPPPSFAGDDITDADGFIRLIRKGETTGIRKLQNALSKLLIQVGYEYDQQHISTIFDYAALNSERLAIYLNRLLEDDTFYQQFQTNVELHDMIRTDLGQLDSRNVTCRLARENCCHFKPGESTD